MIKIIVSSTGVDSALWEMFKNEGILKPIDTKTIQEIIEEDCSFKIYAKPEFDPLRLNDKYYPAPKSKYHK